MKYRVSWQRHGKPLESEDYATIEEARAALRSLTTHAVMRCEPWLKHPRYSEILPRADLVRVRRGIGNELVSVGEALIRGNESADVLIEKIDALRRRLAPTLLELELVTAGEVSA